MDCTPPGRRTRRTIPAKNTDGCGTWRPKRAIHGLGRRGFHHRVDHRYRDPRVSNTLTARLLALSGLVPVVSVTRPRLLRCGTRADSVRPRRSVRPGRSVLRGRASPALAVRQAACPDTPDFLSKMCTGVIVVR